MILKAPSEPIPVAKFVILLALMISIVALSTDMMLPALGLIGADLGVADANDTQLVVSSLFLGFAAGQTIAGPISDSVGRKPVIYAGYLLFIAGCLLSIFLDQLHRDAGRTCHAGARCILPPDRHHGSCA